MFSTYVPAATQTWSPETAAFEPGLDGLLGRRPGQAVVRVVAGGRYVNRPGPDRRHGRQDHRDRQDHHGHPPANPE